MTRRQRQRSSVLHSEALEPRMFLTVGGTYAPPTDPRDVLNIDAGWKFIKSDPANAQTTGFNDSAWSTVSVPHTWNATDAQDGGNNYYRGTGWYRKSVVVPSSMVGETIHVRFEGASIAAALYVDGTRIGSHVGAFGGFDFDVTSQLASGGSHLLAVKVDNSASYDAIAGPEGADFPMFGGIYRDVSLIGVASQHVTVDDFASSGVKFSTPSVSSSSATTNLVIGLSNDASSSKNLSITSYVVDATGKIVAQSTTTPTLNAGADASITQTATIANPHLWKGTADPYLHNLYVEVRDASSNALIDFVKQRVGIRSFSISATQGFLLNGSVYPLHGVALHQDRLNKGWALSDSDIRQDISLIGDMGANAIRTAHYEQNELVYDLADEKGIILLSEVPNVASNVNGDIPTSAAFLSSMQQQLKEMIRQRFNHPSVAFWGVFNEIGDTATNQTIVQNLNALAKSEDPTRKTVGASYAYALRTVEQSVDAAAYNRYYGWYYGVPSDFAFQLDQLHSQNPSALIGVSEYGAGGSITQHSDSTAVPQYDGPFHPEEYESLYHEQTYALLKARPFLWGTFAWNMFDFAVDYRDEGDTPGRNDKGLVTYDRATKKDAFYFYKANWSSDPVVHLNSSRWTERTAAATKIKFYTNLTNPTVTLNGVVVGSLTNAGNDVWTSPTVNLQPGNNVVVLSATRNGTTYTDSVTWHMPGGTTATAPAAVSGLAATAASATSVSLAWTDNSTNETGFRIERRLGTSGAWSVLATVGAGVKSYVDSTAATSTTYNYQVFAINSAGASPASNVATVTTPAAPVTVPAAATGLMATASSATSALLTWNDNSSDETGFRIERRLGTSGTWGVLTTVGANVKTYLDNSALAGSTYNYQVFAVNAAGASSASNTASVTMPVADAYASADIGSPTLAGATSILTPGKEYDVTAGGSDVWGTADQFRFVYKTITGDFDYSARIADVSIGNSGSMAGLMARESLTAGSQHMYSRATASNQALGNYRLTTGGTSVGVSGGPTVAFPNIYVRLKRAGNVFTTFGSADGLTWTQITQQTMTMPATIYFGIAVSARTSSTTTTAKIRDLTDRTTLPTVPAAPTNLVATPNTATPSIGLTWLDNASTEAGYRVERKAAGATVWSTLATLGVGATSYADAAIAFGTQFTYRVFATNSVGDSAPTAEVSLTIAAPAGPSAPLAPTNLSASNAGGGGTKLVWSDNSTNELYFQVERQGDDGAWASIAIVAPNTTTYADPTVSAGAAYTYRVRGLGSVADGLYSNEAAFVAPSTLAYSSIDIGGISGGATQTITDGSAYNVTASGSDIWEKADQFRFVYRKLTGDFDIRVRVNSVSLADVQSMAGLMARASLEANSRNAFLKVRADGKNRVTYRGTTGGTSVGLGDGTSTFPGAWLRLARIGNRFIGFASTDGLDWTVISNANLSLPKTLYVGLAVSSHVAGTTTTAEFRDLSLVSDA